MRPARWSEREDGWLVIAAGGGLRASEIAFLLTDPPRSRDAVIGRARRLGVAWKYRAGARRRDKALSVLAGMLHGCDRGVSR
jgi:hypothetical protein